MHVACRSPGPCSRSGTGRRSSSRSSTARRSRRSRAGSIWPGASRGCGACTRAATALVLAPAIVLGGVAAYATVKHRRTEAADARAVTFAAFAAPDLHQTHADVFPDYDPELNLRYERGGGELSVSQVVAEDDDLTPPQCQAHDGTPFHAWYGPCRSARTPRGRLVAVVEMQIGVASFAGRPRRDADRRLRPRPGGRGRSARARRRAATRRRRRDPLGAVKFSRRSADVLVQVAPRSHDHPAEHHAQRLRRLRLRLLSRLAI